MLKRLAALILALGLCGCGVVTAPNPERTEWPFGGANSLKFEVLAQFADPLTNQEDPTRLFLSISRGEKANDFYFSSEGEGERLEGQIWLRTRFGDNRIGFAFSPNETTQKRGQTIQYGKEAIFGYLDEDIGRSTNNFQEMTLVLSQCGKSITSANFRKPTVGELQKCDFATSNDAWGYVFDRANKESFLILDLQRQDN